MPFFVEDISGSRAWASFLVDDDASTIVASIIVPDRGPLLVLNKRAFTAFRYPRF